jgi:hypothetical protein
VATADDGTYFFLTYGFRDLSDWGKWTAAEAAIALPSGPTTTPPGLGQQKQWFMLERPEWSYVPENPRMERERAGFVHWDIYLGRQTAVRWGLTTEEAQSAGYLNNPMHFSELVELHRARGVVDGFNVYTSYASSHPHGLALVIETWARDEKEYYSRLVATQRELGARGHELLVALHANASVIEKVDLEILPQLSYAGPR